MNKYVRRRCMSHNSIIYVGIDVHERESQVAVLEKNGKLLLEDRVPTSKLEEFISSVEGKKNVAVESVGFIHTIYERLSSIDSCKVYVANSNKLNLISQSTTKNDRNDARILGCLLRMNYLPLAHIRDKETREKLYVVNDKVAYWLRRGELRTTIRWLLKRRSIDIEDERPFSDERRDKVKEIHIREIDLRLKELEFVEPTIEELDRRVNSIAVDDHKARLLDTFPGVAPYTTLFLACILDDIDRFPDTKHARAQLGLEPWLDETTDTTHLGHITMKGDKWLRRKLVECARVAVRKDPHMREFCERMKRRRGERKAIIAIARQLVSYSY
jgi:transposase